MYLYLIPCVSSDSGTATYRVSDLAAARDWYSQILGTAPYFDKVFYIGFKVAGYELGLQPEEETPAAKPETVLTYWGGSRCGISIRASAGAEGGGA
ncbi:MAG: hypothetical protein SF053_04515 [Bacteroidia bacterium]|nr:hypothetical protein [Bacteroidia bacterium]